MNLDIKITSTVFGLLQIDTTNFLVLHSFDFIPFLSWTYCFALFNFYLMHTTHTLLHPSIFCGAFIIFIMVSRNYFSLILGCFSTTHCLTKQFDITTNESWLVNSSINSLSFIMHSLHFITSLVVSKVTMLMKYHTNLLVQ